VSQSRDFFRQSLRVAAIAGGLAVVPVTVFLCYVGYYLWMPWYSVVAPFPQFGFNLRLDFYQTGEGTEDTGRYLSLITDSAYHTFMMGGFGWARRARTNIYRIDEGQLAVLSPMGNDYRITIHPFAIVPVVSDSGAGWQYLGAFDFAFPAQGKPRLQFFDAQLPECIPMVGDPSKWTTLPRATARQASCQTPP